MGEGYTIAEAAKRTGLTVHTLRYYEQAGLIEPVARSKSGRRRYTQSDIEHVRLLTTLRNSGMSVADLRRYVELSRSRMTAPELRGLLLKHRQEIYAQLGHLREALKEIDTRLRSTQPDEAAPKWPAPVDRDVDVRQVREGATVSGYSGYSGYPG